MTTNKGEGLDLAFESANESIEVGSASALEGGVKGRLGYTLTTQALKEEEAIMVFPLLALSSESIVEGLATYLAEEELAETATARVASIVASSEKKIQEIISSFE
ncbi:hypothetical protein MLD52_14790 [Puniceicoccaceae bacterium K14]|nr:hypothetical protein [Puniceicoccaceae bacterium K14]